MERKRGSGAWRIPDEPCEQIGPCLVQAAAGLPAPAGTRCLAAKGCTFSFCHRAGAGQLPTGYGCLPARPELPRLLWQGRAPRKLGRGADQSAETQYRRPVPPAGRGRRSAGQALHPAV